MLTQQSAPAVDAGTVMVPRRRNPVERLPDLIAGAVTGFALPAMVLLMFGRFVPPLVLGLGLVGALAAVVGQLRLAEPAAPRDLLWTAGALLLAVAFFGINARWSAQNIYATRDPATYGLAGQWL